MLRPHMLMYHMPRNRFLLNKPPLIAMLELLLPCSFFHIPIFDVLLFMYSFSEKHFFPTSTLTDAFFLLCTCYLMVVCAL